MFLSTLEKGGGVGSYTAPKRKKGEGEYYLEDDDALMRLLQRLQMVGESSLQQRLTKAGDFDGSITSTQFRNALTVLGGITPND